MSAIGEIYTRISKMKVSGVKCRNIDKVRLAIRSRDLPMRMLLPSTTGDLSFIAIGTLNNIQWVIRDLCLWAPLTGGKGIEQYSNSMVIYLKEYIAALKRLRNPTGQSTIMAVSFAMGPIPWGDNDYWAVDIQLTVEEIL